MTHSPERAHAVAMNAVDENSPAPASRIITTYLASLRASGYVVVPVELTIDMRQAALAAAWPNGDPELCRRVFDAALAAAPVSPPEADALAPPAEPGL